MDRSNINKISQNPEDRLLLAKLWDKIQSGIRKNIPSATCFLTSREQEMAKYLFGQWENLHFIGGYPEAERKMLLFLPDYWELLDFLQDEDCPLCCIHADFYQGDSPSHKDFLGALMASGIGRETLGDICVGEACCDFFATKDITPHILQNLFSAGRAHLQLSQVPLDSFIPPTPKTQEIKDTVASLRLDALVSSGFRIGRSLAAQHIAAGKVAIDGLPCEKADKPVTQGMKISLRGMGKIVITAINGTTKKGRISVTIHRYI